MATAMELVRRFGGDLDTLTSKIGGRNGWGWADVVLAHRLPREFVGENPYEYRAFDLIADEWRAACDSVERDEPGADERLRALLDRYEQAMGDND